MLPLLLALLRSLLVSGAPFPQHRYDVPALFVFGDSFVDSGNNNFFNTSAKCNHPPYGINFEGRRSTGRWSDGLIVTDYIGIEISHLVLPFLLLSRTLCWTASFLGLPYPPNFHDKRANFSTGANFASASAGIFNTTGLVRRRKAMIQSHELCPPLEARHPDV
ncbi:GDSL esterase/lipase At2g03980-like [Selaginella moellendorffii]|uniref:GDSL esterase/lipase At2g03980-like n=1 Tax=Selaginella moellendorffii TaxID=88036 RepID=UPI000D1D118C|nr:GDSL esterase/lipase At2g03980-like [Selaginella moellendorffii]|eukprot:XP_024519411.1 GDSL esterase/lipase At2g03980-like [Selaginella moellendorffii]